MASMKEALGLVETQGLVAGIEALDTMLKAANVHVLACDWPGSGRMTVMVGGDVGAVNAAVEAGATAARKVSEVLAVQVIPRPDAFTGKLVELSQLYLGTSLAEEADVDMVEAPKPAKGKRGGSK